MLKTIFLLSIWISFIIYAFFFAPANSNTLDLVTDLSTGNWKGINPYIISMFNMMGILPIMYASLIIIDGEQQKLPTTPFVVCSFFVGAFALLPYLAFRNKNTDFEGKKDYFEGKKQLLKILDSKTLGVLLAISITVLFVYAISQGNFSDFIEQWHSNRFVNVMSLDFCLLCFLFPTLIGDDLAKRGIENQTVFWSISLIPLFGTLLYFCFRPNLPELDKAKFDTLVESKK